jgi:catechol-2,3-dioxygenase
MTSITARVLNRPTATLAVGLILVTATVLAKANAYTGESSHGATLSVYGVDPDGNEFEIMWMLPRDAWGEYANNAVIEELILDTHIARWSGVRTAWELPRDTQA